MLFLLPQHLSLSNFFLPLGWQHTIRAAGDLEGFEARGVAVHAVARARAAAVTQPQAGRATVS